MSLLAQWRADQEVYEDTGGTDAAEDTDAVASWGVYAGTFSASIATQSTSGRRPVYAANDGGYPSLTFSNTNKSSLLLPYSASWAQSALTWLTVIKPVKPTGAFTAGGNGVLCGRGANWDEGFGVHINAAAVPVSTPAAIVFQHDNYTARICAATFPASSATWFVVCGCFDASGMRLCVNRQSVVRLSQSRTVAMGTSAIAIGADADNTGYSYNGAMREIAFWDTALSETDMATEIDAAMARWGITNSVSPPSSGSTVIVIED